jgi:hypothetical protein
MASVVLVEDASRFARDLIAQVLGVLTLIKRGIRVITTSGDDLTDTTVRRGFDLARDRFNQCAGAHHHR